MNKMGESNKHKNETPSNQNNDLEMFINEAPLPTLNVCPNCNHSFNYEEYLLVENEQRNKMINEMD